LRIVVAFAVTTSAVTTPPSRLTSAMLAEVAAVVALALSVLWAVVAAAPATRTLGKVRLAMSLVRVAPLLPPHGRWTAADRPEPSRLPTLT
jgi:hypothetical protein